MGKSPKIHAPDSRFIQGLIYGSFSVRLVFIEGWFSRYDGLVWGLFAIGLGFVLKTLFRVGFGLI